MQQDAGKGSVQLGLAKKLYFRNFGRKSSCVGLFDNIPMHAWVCYQTILFYLYLILFIFIYNFLFIFNRLNAQSTQRFIELAIPKVSSFTRQFPVARITQSTVHFSLGKPVYSNTKSTSFSHAAITTQRLFFT